MNSYSKYDKIFSPFLMKLLIVYKDLKAIYSMKDLIRWEGFAS